MSIAPTQLPSEPLEDLVWLAEEIASERELESEGNKWCVFTASEGAALLRDAGLPALQRQAPDWVSFSHVEAADGSLDSTPLLRENCGFLHPDDPARSDPSHCWIELADGTILDPTISQFELVEFPHDERWPTLAIIAPKHPFARCYNAAPAEAR